MLSKINSRKRPTEGSGYQLEEKMSCLLNIFHQGSVNSPLVTSLQYVSPGEVINRRAIKAVWVPIGSGLYALSKIKLSAFIVIPLR